VISRSPHGEPDMTTALSLMTGHDQFESARRRAFLRNAVIVH
jgi:hypothetical protein